MAKIVQESGSTLVEYLPSIYQKDEYIGSFLKAFEKILLGLNDGVKVPNNGSIFEDKGFEEIIDVISVIFDPNETPELFLEWLSEWTGFSIRADLTTKQQRDFLSRIIKLYRQRGTKENLQELLSIFTVGVPEVREVEGTDFQVGINSNIGDESVRLGGAQPHYFEVLISLPEGIEKKHQELNRQLEIARSLIEMEKPAHTYYKLIPKYPSMQIGESSTIGIDTLLGSIPEN